MVALRRAKAASSASSGRRQWSSPRAITINAVLPGSVFTKPRGPRAGLPRRDGRVDPHGQAGQPKDIGNAALFLASAEAGYITGQTLVVDGGQVLPESLEALQEMWP